MVLGGSTTSSRMIKGATVLFASRLATKIIDCITLLILARLLNPSDFGLVAKAMTLIYIIEAILELPTTQVLIRLEKITKPFLDTAFTFNAIRSLSIFFIIISVSGVYSNYSEDTRLRPVLLVLSLAPIFRGMISPSMVFYAKELDFRFEVLVDILGKFISCLFAISFAYAYRSYWAIAVATVMAPVIACLCSYIIAPYRPRICLNQWQEFSHFVTWNLASQLMLAIGWQFDRLLLGRFVSTDDFGIFSVSGDIVNLLFQALLVPINRSISSAMLNESANLQRLQSIYLKSSEGMSIVGAPLFIGMALLSEQIVQVSLGSNWQGSAKLLPIMALSVLTMLPTMAWNNAAIAVKQSQWVTSTAGIELLLRIPIALTLIQFYGIYGAAYTRIIMGIITSLIAAFCIKKILFIDYRKMLAAISRPIYYSCAMLSLLVPLSYLFDDLKESVSPFIEAVIFICIGGSVYLGLAYLIWTRSKDPGFIEDLVFKKIRNLFSFNKKRVEVGPNVDIFAYSEGDNCRFEFRDKLRGSSYLVIHEAAVLSLLISIEEIYSANRSHNIQDKVFERVVDTTK